VLLEHGRTIAQRREGRGKKGTFVANGFQGFVLGDVLCLAGLGKRVWNWAVLAAS